jgi:hypothetical protein
MDFNLVDLAAEQAAIREQQEHACAEYLFKQIDWQKTMPPVLEQLNTMQPEALEKALVEFVKGNSLTLRLLLDKVAMDDCEASASKLVAIHGANWLLALENEL